VRTVSVASEAELKKKNQTLSLDGTPLIIEADKDRIAQVVTNLLSNAIKYTPENGSIRISVSDAEKNGVITVVDDGIGIPEPELSLIFERFYRTDQSRSRKSGGAGIGLAIVKSIVSAHGGTVEAFRRDGRGSRFVVTLPKCDPS
jgi:signal transduction histidine kinase